MDISGRDVGRAVVSESRGGEVCSTDAADEGGVDCDRGRYVVNVRWTG